MRLNGINLAVRDSGGNGPVLLLVHGFALDHRMWEPQFEACASDWRVLAPDLRGFGASEAGPAGPLSMRQHAEDIDAMLTALDVQEPVVYAGLSMGGYIGFELWRRYRGRIRAMVFADTKATLDDAARRAYREAMAQEAEAEGSSDTAIRTMWPNLCSPRRSLQSEVPMRLQAIMAAQSARAIADGQRGMAQREDALPLLPTIDVPTLVIVGADDRLTPPVESRLMAERLPACNLVEIVGAGHMSNMEDPATFNHALSCWASSLLTNAD